MNDEKKKKKKENYLSLLPGRASCSRVHLTALTDPWLVLVNGADRKERERERERERES